MKYIIFSLIYLLLLFSVSKFFFDPAHLYYELPWLDIPMHIAGGFGVALLAASFLKYKNKKITFLKIFIIYALVAIFWEMYEYIHDIIRGNEMNNIADTVSDFFNGIIGSCVAYLLIRKK